MTNKLSRILVGVDFSEPSLNALNMAATLAAKDGSTLYIVHVQDCMFERIVSSKPLQENHVNNSSSILAALASDIGRKSKIKTQVIEEESYAAECLLRNMIKLKCDLAVLGTYGASDFRAGYAGTTAYTVTKYAPCPVLLIPAGREWTLSKKPIFPVRPVMTAMRHYNIIRHFLEKDCSLQILGLSRPGEDREENVLHEIVSELEAVLKSDQVTTNIGWNTEHTLSRNVLTLADKSRSDLIVLTTAIDVSNKQFFIGPISHYIIHNAKIPILVINKMNGQGQVNGRGGK